MSSPGSLPPGFEAKGDAKLTVIVRSRQLRELEHQAKTDRLTITEAIQRALEIGIIVWRAVRKGERVLIRSVDGDVREIDVRLRS